MIRLPRSQASQPTWRCEALHAPPTGSHRHKGIAFALETSRRASTPYTSGSKGQQLIWAHKEHYYNGPQARGYRLEARIAV